MLWGFLLYLLVQAAILHAIQPETFEAATTGTTTGNSSAFAMAIYFSFITDTTTCYGDIGMARDPPNGRVALFFLASFGMLIVGIGVGAVSNVMMQCCSNEPDTGFKTLNGIVNFFRSHKILSFLGLYLGLLNLGAAIFMWLPYVENENYHNETALGHETHWGYDEAFYWGWVSFTTCGYGDVTHQSVTGRILQIFYAAVTIGFFGSTVSLAAIWLETRFDRILRSRLPSEVKSKNGIGAEKFISNIIGQINQEFPKHAARKDLYTMLVDQLETELDELHTHLGTQAKFGATHKAAGRGHNSPRRSPRDEEL